MEYSLHKHLSPKFQRVVLPLLLFSGLLFFATFGRFNQITIQGTVGSDEFGYLKEAKLWADGKPPQFIQKMIFYRPAIFLLHSWAVRVGGWNDYSIKMLHAFMDICNISLIFLIAYILSKNWWNAFSALLLYSFLPTVIEHARSELIQIPTTTFMLLSIAFLVLFQKYEDSPSRKTSKTIPKHKVFGLTREKGLFLFISGFWLGVAANIHGDMALLGPGCVVYLFFVTLSHRQMYKFWLTLVSYAFIFTLAFFTPYLIGVLGFGAKLVYFVMSREVSLHTGPPVGLLVLLKLFFQAFQHHFGNALVMTILFFALPSVMLVRKWKKYRDPSLAYLPFILILSYMGGSLLTMSQIRPIDFARISFPLFPLTILGVNYWYYKILEGLNDRFATPAWLVVAVSLFLIHDKVPLSTDYSWGEKHSAYREVYDVLKDHVNSRDRLLITPVIAYSINQIYPGGFRSGVYFGSKNAVYQCHLFMEEQYNVQSFKQLVSSEHIRFVFISHDRLIDTRMLNPFFFPSWTQNENFTYSLEEDRRIVFQYIQQRNGRLIYYGYWGLLYELEPEWDQMFPQIKPYSQFLYQIKSDPLP